RYYFDGLALGAAGKGDLSRRCFYRSDTGTDVCWTFTYNANGDILSETDPAGVTDTRTYESTYGRLATIEDAAGNTLTYGYDPVFTAAVAAVTDPNGNVATASYDSFGRIKQAHLPHNGSTSSIVQADYSTSPFSRTSTIYRDDGSALSTTAFVD